MIMFSHHVECVDKILKCDYTDASYDLHVLSLNKLLKDGTCQYRDIFTKVMITGEKQILARFIGI